MASREKRWISPGSRYRSPPPVAAGQGSQWGDVPALALGPDHHPAGKQKSQQQVGGEVDAQQAQEEPEIEPGYDGGPEPPRRLMGLLCG